MKLEHIVASFIIFAVLVGLMVTGYNGLMTNYGVTKTATNGSGSDVMDQLNSLNIITGINESITAAYTIGSPDASKVDVLGGLAVLGIGAVKVVTGIITTPIEIMMVIIDFYYIPPIVFIGIGIIFIVYVAFILLRYYTRTE